MKKETFFMVFVEGGDAPTFKHSTLLSAQNEAKRLARLTKRKATVLCSYKSYEIIEFQEAEVLPDDLKDLPF